MSAMSGQFALELEFKTKNRNPLHPEKQLVIVDEGSISELSKLREDLGNFTSEPFMIQYIDEENDVISIDTEEEFKEFTKLVKQRSSKGELLKVILNCNSVSAPERKLSNNQNAEASGSNCDPWTKEMERAEDEFNAFALEGLLSKEWKMKFKQELKQEILSEMKEEFEAADQPSSSQKEIVEYEEDSDGNLVCLPGKRKVKVRQSIKKLEKKEKLSEAKIDHRLEKLELKKKKLLEKASLRAANRNSVFHNLGLPYIMSGIATRDSVFLSKKVVVAKVFIHQWRVINDGTVPWSNVQLQHTWSTPGLEPDELSLKCPQLVPGQDCHLMMRFKAPKTVGPFVSYWHFVYGPQWNQFGHYVSLSGNTRLSKLTSATTGQTKEQDCHKKSKSVSFKEESESQPVNCRPTVDGKSYSEEEIKFKNQLEASLASAEIAAEMAREAANAALRVASGMQTTDSQAPSDMEQVTKSCQELQLVDSGSDTDVNMDVNEETDPGFVIVNIPSSSSSEQIKPKDKSIQAFNVDAKEEKEANVLQTQKKGEKTKLKKKVDFIKQQVNMMTKTKKDREKVIDVAEEINEPRQFEPVAMSYNLNNEGPAGHKTFSKLAGGEQPLHLAYPPRLNTNLDFSGFCPPPRVAMYPPQQHPTPFPVFTPQSSSHANFFPPPPINYMSPPKINAPHYPQIPTYPPLISVPSVMAPAAEIPLPPLPLQSSTFTPPISQNCQFPQNVQMFNPHVFNYEQPTENPTTELALTDGEVKAICASTTKTPEASSTLPTVNVEKKTDNSNQQAATDNTSTGSAPHLVNNGTTGPVLDRACSDGTVQILPQGLVDGAINVASTAYSHAWNALNNLRPKECETQEFDPVFENNMTLLVEMGFRNVERNSRLLKRFKNDVSQVIGVICASPGGDNLEID